MARCGTLSCGKFHGSSQNRRGYGLSTARRDPGIWRPVAKLGASNLSRPVTWRGFQAAVPAGLTCRRLAHRASRERPFLVALSSVASRSDCHSLLGSTPAVLSIGCSPEVAIAAARSLRRLAHRFRDTLACIGTTPSNVFRMAARSIGIVLSGSPAGRVCGSRRALGCRRPGRRRSAGWEPVPAAAARKRCGASSWGDLS
jgi:hypothetical protein